uniref:Putative ovule protein n=1 Tax=Solanum chacoense TaxID=4108 RepID=A0A0V0H1U7_SOLCH
MWTICQRITKLSIQVHVHRLLFSILVHTIRQMSKKVSDTQRQNNILECSNHTYSSTFPNLHYLLGAYLPSQGRG